MRKTLLLFMLLSVKLTFGQFSDDFSDGNFSSNPTWIGNTSGFNINANKQLQTSLSSVAQTVVLSTESFLALNTKWEFFVRMDFDPSTANQARIYLIADKQDLTSALNGYFIQIGESGSVDSYDLYRQMGTTVTKIIDGAAKPRANADLLQANIRVTRDEVGKWELFTDVSLSGNFVSEGTITDITHQSTEFFGVSCKYTATRSTGFVFDNFSVSELTPDVTPPSLLSAKAIDANNIEAVFSERLETTSALLKTNYSLSQIGAPNTIIYAGNNTYKLNFSSALPNGEYKLTVSNVKDLKGNTIGVNNAATLFYVAPYTIKKGDVLISEILANPKTGGVDFVEIYNNTNQILDVKGLQLANADASGNPANIKNITSSSVYIPAKTYWVLTTNPTIIKAQYKVQFEQQFIQMTSFPAFNNDKGTVILMNGTEVLESFSYNEKMHMGLLKDGDGVSLERISFTADANSPGNFTSSAQAVGFATPTYKNSQNSLSEVNRNSVSLSNKVFSPDDDGFEDQLNIEYRFANAGNLANVNIYTDRGILVKKLERNTTISTVGNFIWDGLDDSGRLSKIGIYVVKFDVFALSGKTESFKQTCVLAAKLN
ncbi:MAG: hypothetical protein EOO90_22625 [Pedobacter sp.]|nr:MAG: hypothetical protein EOO90_22625 [Pedobacter sp.]